MSAENDSLLVSKSAELEKALETAQTEDEKMQLTTDFNTLRDKVRHRKLGYMR